MFLTLFPDFSVLWTKDEPQSAICWKREVSIGILKHVIVASCIPQVPYILPVPSQSFSVPVLKSNLQKAVRRGFADVAAATAVQMAAQGSIADLFRRLPIILLEDTLLETVIMPRWIWWMLATSRGWSLSKQEWNQLCLDIRRIAQSRFREDLRKTDQEICTETLDGLWEIPADRGLALFCIWIRSQWGGMRGDMAWLRDLFLRWLHRGDTEWLSTRLNTTSHGSASGDSLPIFDPKIHALPEAVDFHCCTAMLRDFAAKTGASEADIQEAIWWHRSETNVRPWFPNKADQTIQTTQVDQKLRSRTLFETLNFDSYVRRAWAPISSKHRQMNILSLLSGSKKGPYE